jgi:hypothetical protein
MEEEMNARKLGLAAALLVGSTSLVFAQAGAGGEPTKGSDPNAPAAVKQQPGETKSAPVNPQAGPAPGMTQRPTGMQNDGMKEPPKAGTETGTAKDPAGPGATRKGGDIK